MLQWDMAARLPPVFLSHGSPLTALGGDPASAFWHELGAAPALRDAPPPAIVALSAHTRAAQVQVLAADRHQAVHDFSGFPSALYALRYDCAGAPGLARRVAALLSESGVVATLSDAGGLDHGIWVPLRSIRPGADLPVLPIAFPAHWTPRQLFALGTALRPLVDEGHWIVATGAITHNLRLGLPRPGVEEAELPECAAFRAWFAERAAARDWAALWDYRRRAPYAEFMHPTDEHLLPWFIAAGAGGPCDFGVRIHASIEGSHLGMDAYAFGPQARCLADALDGTAA